MNGQGSARILNIVKSHSIAMKLLLWGDLSPYKIHSDQFHFDDRYYSLRKEYDLFIANLENPITCSTEQLAHQVLNLSSSPENAYPLLTSIDAVSLANNHVLDYKEPAILDTIEFLNKNNIGWFGVGESAYQALCPYTFEKGRQKLAVFGATRYANTKNGHWGTAPDSTRNLEEQIIAYKQEGYFVVVYFHWGYEYVRIPSPRERRIAHRCINSGADLILGSHPHVYQAIEKYRGKYILYSIGNFIFHSSVYQSLSPLADNSPINNSFAVGVDVNEIGNYEITIYGYKTDDLGIRFYSEEENAELINDINDISSVLSAGKSHYLKEYYKQAYSISHQNARVRNSFQKKGTLSVRDRLALYSNANMQDVKNKGVGMLMSLFVRSEK